MEIKTESSAGGIVRKKTGDAFSILLIRVRKEGLEIPKGHIEAAESAEEAAKREIKEETGLLSELKTIKTLGKTAHAFEKDGVTTQKEVTYFLFETINAEEPVFGKKPSQTREIVWLERHNERLNEIMYSQLLEFAMKSFEG